MELCEQRYEKVTLESKQKKARGGGWKECCLFLCNIRGRLQATYLEHCSQQYLELLKAAGEFTGYICNIIIESSIEE